MSVGKSVRFMIFTGFAIATSGCELGGTSNEAMKAQVAAKKASQLPVEQQPVYEEFKPKTGRKREPIRISSKTGLSAIRNDLAGEYILDRDISLVRGNGDPEWTPIGTPDKPFTGHLDGNGKTISGLTLTDTSGRPDLALFGSNNGYIENLTIKKFMVIGAARAAAVAAHNMAGGVIAKVIVTESEIGGGHVVGGIVGLNNGVVASSTFSKGILSATGRTSADGIAEGLSFASNPRKTRVGGIAGRNVGTEAKILDPFSDVEIHVGRAVAGETVKLHRYAAESTLALPTALQVGESPAVICFGEGAIIGSSSKFTPNSDQDLPPPEEGFQCDTAPKMYDGPALPRAATPTDVLRGLIAADNEGVLIDVTAEQSVIQLFVNH